MLYNSKPVFWWTQQLWQYSLMSKVNESSQSWEGGKELENVLETNCLGTMDIGKV